MMKKSKSQSLSQQLQLTRTLPTSKELLRSSSGGKSLMTVTQVLEFQEWKLVSPWQLQFAYDIDNLLVPENIAYEDYLCTRPKKIVNLSEWHLNNTLVDQFCRDGKSTVHTIKLNHCKGVDFSGFKGMRGMSYLHVLSIRGLLTITADVAKVIGSLKKLQKLDLSENTVESAALSILGQTCAQLSTLYLQKCRGLDNSSMAIIFQFVQRFRKLEKLDFAGTEDFTDDGCLFMLTAAPSVTLSLSFEGCKQLTSLAFTTFRQRFARLEYLNLSNTNVGNSVFEWISEGCLALKTVNFHNCKNFDNNGLTLIGRRCILLEDLYITNCELISDAGFVGFYQYFLGSLKRIDISGCIHCGAMTCKLLSLHAKDLVEAKFNGLSNVAGEWLNQLLLNAVNLEVFEMFVEIKLAVTHRLSTVPHISDDTIAKMGSKSIKHFKIAGAFLVSDIGVKVLASKCPNLAVLDVATCSNVTDDFLSFLATDVKDSTAKSLTELNLSGCNKITDQGLRYLANSCPNLKCLMLAGCGKITDEGVLALSQLASLEELSLRHCDYVSESSLIVLTNSLKSLKVLDIASLDLVTVEVVKSIALNAQQLIILNCEQCDMAVKEYHDVLKHPKYKLPFAMPVINYRKLEPRPKSIIEYNRYVLDMRAKDKAIRVIQKLALWMHRMGNLHRSKMSTTARLALEEHHRQQMLRETRKLLRSQNKTSRQSAASSLQKHFRKWMSVRFAKKKVKDMRLKKKASTILQKVYRGHLARKRTKRLFRILYQHYSRFGHIIHKMMVISAARVLHRRILLVQSWLRMLTKRLPFLRAKRGIILFQKRIRRRFKYSIITRKVISGIITTIERREAGAMKLQRNFKAQMFNKTMSKFMLVCAIYYRTECDLQNWYSSIIQRYWRGYACRLRLYHERMAPFKVDMAMTRLQARWRRKKTQQWYKLYKRSKKRIMRRWRALLWCGKPALRLGYYARRIQRRFRIFCVVHRKEWSAVSIQRAYRGYKARQRWKNLVYDLKLLYILRIQRICRLFVSKKRRILMVARYHMAAYKLQKWIQSGFDNNSTKRIAARKAAKMRKKHLQEKKDIILKRRIRAVERCKTLLLGAYAQRIQRKYRVWKDIKEKRLAAANFRSQAVKESRSEMLNEQLGGMLKNFKPLKVVTNAVQRLRNSLNAMSGDIHVDDVMRMRSAVLSSQTKTILQEGVVELHVTVGEKEKEHFLHDQERLRHASEPYFEMIPYDISGKLMGLQLHLWYMKGTGRESICELEIDNIPPGMSNTKLRDRIIKQRNLGTKIAWHPSLHIEFRGQCTIMQGKGGFALSDIIAAYDERESEKLEQAGYKLVKRLLKFGFNSSIWVKQRSAIDDPDIFKLGLLSVRPWSNAYLMTTVKKFNLSEADVMSMRETFEWILKGQYRQTAPMELIVEKFEYPYTQLSKWVCNAINPTRPNELTFPEYVHMICYYVMFDTVDLMRFLFGQADSASKGFLDREQFTNFMEVLAEESSGSSLVWSRQFEDFWNRKLKTLFFEGFDAFAKINPASLWPAQSLQRKFMDHNLGQGYWDKKVNDFRLVRLDMGVRLI